MTTPQKVLVTGAATGIGALASVSPATEELRLRLARRMSITGPLGETRTTFSMTGQPR